MAGRSMLTSISLTIAGSAAKTGTVRALAITSAQRNPAFPDVPTVSEVIGKPYESYEWNGIFLPKGTSPEIVNRLQVAVKEVLAMPEVKGKFDSLGSSIVASTPEEFRSTWQARPSDGLSP